MGSPFLFKLIIPKGYEPLKMSLARKYRKFKRKVRRKIFYRVEWIIYLLITSITILVSFLITRT